MKKRFQYITTIALAFVISGCMTGCSIFSDVITDQVVDVVETYCEEPLNAREVYRAEVNNALLGLGHHVEVHCSGDPVVSP